MFGSLSKKISAAFYTLYSSRRITQESLSDVIREVRLALLDADVNYQVVKRFVASIKEKIIGKELWKQATPEQQFLDCMHEELQNLLYDGREEILLKGSPAIILLCGMQGVGKTTTCGKIAAYLTKFHKVRKSLLVPCDLKRMAAVDQLRIVGNASNSDVYKDISDCPIKTAESAVQYAKDLGYDVVIIDTAGRLSIDQDLMNELSAISSTVKPIEKLFVMNIATGQDILNTAHSFDNALGLTGIVVSMTDSDAKAGALLSIRNTLKVPIKFEGCGERIEDLRPFSAISIADRILGLGDSVNLSREIKQVISEEDEQEFTKKIENSSLNYEDYYKQIQAFKRLGSLKKLIGMLPAGFGMPNEEELVKSEQEMKRTEAMILSMTLQERREEVGLSQERMKRIAKGSGVSLEDVVFFRKKMKESKKIFKGMTKEKMESLSKKMNGGRKLWD